MIGQIGDVSHHLRSHLGVVELIVMCTFVLQSRVF